MNVGFVLPGIHRVHRGAEVALEATAGALAQLGHRVTVVGGGPTQPDRPYHYRQRPLIDRRHFERFPRVRPFHSDVVYEELTFALGLIGRRDLVDADVTLTSGYPFMNWMLTRTPKRSARPAHVFITQNGDFPATWTRGEYHFFRCDGLVCTNPEYEARNRSRWRTALIPNGIDPETFRPGPERRGEFGLPASAPVVLMVSALIESKHVPAGVRAVSALDDAFLVIAGDGPLRAEVDELCADLLPGRHRRLSLPSIKMPDLYRSADVLLHMSRTESFGNVYVEALCTGLPIVAHDHAATRWILGDYPGLVATDHVAVVTEAIARALDAGPSAVASFVGPGANRFSWRTVAQQYERFLLDVIGSHEA